LLEPIINDGLFGEGDQLFADPIVNRFMDISALDRQAYLSAVLECAFEYPGRRLLWIDVVENDRCVVAAELKRDAFECCGGARRHLLACRRRAREGNLADIRMLGHRVAEIVDIGDNVKHARRQDVLDKFGEPQGCERRSRGRLQHNGVACDQRRRRFQTDEQKRIVPGNDCSDDAERTAMGLDAPCR
jgi:hypothetical protein